MKNNKRRILQSTTIRLASSVTNLFSQICLFCFWIELTSCNRSQGVFVCTKHCLFNADFELNDSHIFYDVFFCANLGLIESKLKSTDKKQTSKNFIVKILEQKRGNWSRAIHSVRKQQENNEFLRVKRQNIVILWTIHSTVDIVCCGYFSVCCFLSFHCFVFLFVTITDAN